MSRFNRFMTTATKKAKKWLPTVSVQYQGQLFEAISDSYSYIVFTTQGGDVMRIGRELTVTASDLIATPEHGDTLVIDNENHWKINELNAGDTVIVLRAIDTRYHD